MLVGSSRRLSAFVKLSEGSQERSGGSTGALTGPGPNKILNGTEGRLTKPAVGGVSVKMPQGPRAYAPRVSKV
jgi:hypothetical protein